MFFNCYSSLYYAIVLKALKLNLMMLPALNLQEVSLLSCLCIMFLGYWDVVWNSKDGALNN